MRAAVKLQLPGFLLSQRRKAGNCSYTADESGGKAATASFPPLRAEEDWKMDLTADENGGKAAIASFPPLREEENWKMRVYRPCKQR